MKRVVKRIVTKRELADIILRPLIMPDAYKEKCIEKTIILSNSKILKEARKSTNLDIVMFINDMFIIRYFEYDISEVLPIDVIRDRLDNLVN